MSDLTDLLNNPVPVNKAALYTRLREILALGWQEMPTNVARYNGNGGPGNFLEDLIGLKAGNQDIADVLGSCDIWLAVSAGWTLKAAKAFAILSPAAPIDSM